MHETSPSMQTRHVIVSGRVQGVWFRRWTQETARRLGLYGWVQNLTNGDVEALFTGEKKAVEAMIEACHNGPEHAQVDKVTVHEANAPSLPEKDFVIKRY